MLTTLNARQPYWLSNSRSPLYLQLAAFIALSAALGSSAAEADTAAYWRFEERAPGSLVPAGAETIPDSSGNGNELRTFDPSFTSPDYTSNVSPLALRSGLPNTRSLNFGPGGVDPDVNDNPEGNPVLGFEDDVYTTLQPIDQATFSALTIELAFRMDTVGGFQALFGKDGKPLGDGEGEDDSPVAPFAIKVRGDTFPPDEPPGPPNQLFVEWIDGDGKLFTDIHFLASGETMVANAWYHVAFTLNATEAQLWIAKSTGDYFLKDSLGGQDFAGPDGEVIVFEPLGYSVGRGMFGNGVADWADATIDEVRLSDAVLLPNQFLFVPAPAGDADFDDSGVVDGKDFLTWQKANGGGGDADDRRR